MCLSPEPKDVLTAGDLAQLHTDAAHGQLVPLTTAAGCLALLQLVLLMPTTCSCGSTEQESGSAVPDPCRHPAIKLWCS
jgi:hypothetical protein